MANIRLTLQRTTAPQLFPSRKYALRYSSKMIAGTGGGPLVALLTETAA